MLDDNRLSALESVGGIGARVDVRRGAADQLSDKLSGSRGERHAEHVVARGAAEVLNISH